jgi:GT2 family glycosyltransferase/2-polyprenyl-3-methyl-5-hydroxy-6-metoxy-1,4-benzoquinol methylase
VKVEFTGERFVPDLDNPELEVEHVQRYLSVVDLVKDKVVLDAACGEGYGSYLLAQHAKQVRGIDISEEAISHAASKYNKNNLEFTQGSVDSLDLPAQSVDVVVSFETIEHIDADMQHAFLQEIKRVLKSGGILVISTPDKRWYSDEQGYTNPFHVKEFYKEEFHGFLNQYFKNIEVYYQKFEIASIIGNPHSGGFKNVNHTNNNNDPLSEGKYLISVCSDEQLKDINLNSLDFHHGKSYSWLMNRIVLLQDELEERNLHIEKLDEDLGHLNTYRNELGDSRKEVESLVAQLNAYQSAISAHQSTISAHQSTISHLETEYRNQQGHIEQLLEQDRKLEAIYNSGGWKALGVYYKFRDALLPPRSKRSLLAKLLKMTLKNPRKMLSNLNSGNIKKLKYYLRTEQSDMLGNRIDNYISRHLQVGNDKPLHLIPFAENKEKLTFPIYEKPLVSIIIPVYNQWEYTYSCLYSILQYTENVSYEIIVADDVSTDETVNIGSFIEYITVVRDEVNRGFLLNCNNAAKHARGKYLYFLNNDTNVQPQWLSSLVELMEGNETIGMAGSKLVYPDGKQQEAGGIIWNDASGWNFGRLDDPSKPEYNYVKEVDYISGAAIMIRTELWKQIGGFDERYVPAYNEDSDLAFEVRKHGHKVVYQPASVVVHFEGVSHGTDTGSGIKSYQIENKEKFLLKWKDVLEKEHFPNAENVFQARDRSTSKKTVLVVDHYVPHFDKDAGSRTIYQYLGLFTGLGYNVKFVGDNFYNHEPYTTKLQQMGVEVLYGEWYARHFKEWLQSNGKYIGIVMLNRPHISIKYIDLVRRFTNAKIIYYGHDLHYMRELREYNLTGNNALLQSSEEWKKIEYELIRKSDVTYYPSQVEIDEIAKEIPDINARAIPAYIYDNRGGEPRDIAITENLVFVGGFGHKPNVDAVLWFADNIFPELVKRIPGLKVYIIGSNPPDEIKSRANASFIVTGFVTDDELENYYKQSRIVVVPLRFGAGVKGKVVEAMYHQCPIITTSVGAEGLNEIGSFVEIADTVSEFIERTIALYNNESRLEQLSSGSGEYVKKYFSKESVLQIIQSDFS